MKLIISFPKSGTHLLQNMTNSKAIKLLKKDASLPLNMFMNEDEINLKIDEAMKQPGNYIAHLPFSTNTFTKLGSFENIITILRDPRDIVLSMAFYVEKKKNSAFNFIVGSGRLSDLELHDRIDFLIYRIGDAMELFSPWKNLSKSCIFKYEDDRMDMARRLSEFDYGSPDDIFERSYNTNNVAFRSGKSGEFIKYFTRRQISLANEFLGKYIEEWKTA